MPYIYVIRHSQTYRLLLENFPMPSLSLFNKIQQGGVVALKALKIFYEKGSFFRYCIMMIDEMYLQISAQHQPGQYVK